MIAISVAEFPSSGMGGGGGGGGGLRSTLGHFHIKSVRQSVFIHL